MYTCIMYYKQHGKKCDILMDERGPSVKDIQQLGDLKKIVHVSFVDFFSENSKMMIDDDSMDTRYSPLFMDSSELFQLEYVWKSQSDQNI